jgi:uncharacterized membrane-anchored protein YhcB (DUF1043 family)
VSSVLQKIHDFYANGFWQQLVVKVVCVAVGAIALHYLPANVATKVQEELDTLQLDATPAEVQPAPAQ